MAVASRLVLLAFAALFAGSGAAATETTFTTKDGQVLGRTMGYVGDGMTGTVVVGIVVATDSPASRRDAEIVYGIIGDGLSAGRVKLQAKRVLVDQLSSVAGVDVLFITPGIGGAKSEIAGAAKRLHIPTVSTDLSCIDDARCIVGISTEPTVQIVISRDAADKAGVHFVQAFRMLVREK